MDFDCVAERTKFRIVIMNRLAVADTVGPAQEKTSKCTVLLHVRHYTQRVSSTPNVTAKMLRKSKNSQSINLKMKNLQFCAMPRGVFGCRRRSAILKNVPLLAFLLLFRLRQTS